MPGTVLGAEDIYERHTKFLPSGAFSAELKKCENKQD